MSTAFILACLNDFLLLTFDHVLEKRSINAYYYYQLQPELTKQQVV